MCVIVHLLDVIVFCVCVCGCMCICVMCVWLHVQVCDVCDMCVCVCVFCYVCACVCGQCHLLCVTTDINIHFFLICATPDVIRKVHACILHDCTFMCVLACLCSCACVGVCALAVLAVCRCAVHQELHQRKSYVHTIKTRWRIRMVTD